MSKGKATRENILIKAFELASENGLESLTIGELAKQCAMSKSGLFAHFNSKDNLQVAVLEHAKQVFSQRVISPVRQDTQINIEKKLMRLLDNWLGWNHSFQGSCMFLDAWREMGTETPPTQKALRQITETWIEYLCIQIEKGIESGEFRQELDAKQATFELYGLYLSANLFYSLQGKEVSYQHFWQGVTRLIASWK